MSAREPTVRERFGRELIAHIVVPGEPRAKQRARLDPRGTGHFFTPERTVTRERDIAVLTRAELVHRTPDAESRFEIDAWFFASSWQRRDADNMLKLVCDALNGVIWGDDSQVWDKHTHKRFDAEYPRTEFLVWRTRTAQSPPFDSLRNSLIQGRITGHDDDDMVGQKSRKVAARASRPRSSAARNQGRSALPAELLRRVRPSVNRNQGRPL